MTQKLDGVSKAIADEEKKLTTLVRASLVKDKEFGCLKVGKVFTQNLSLLINHYQRNIININNSPTPNYRLDISIQSKIILIKTTYPDPNPEK